jgi:hypothetical protein
MPVPKMTSKIENRIKDGVKKYSRILKKMKDGGVTMESETSRVVLDILTEVLGYDPYEDITSELKIKRNQCDYAIKDGKDYHKLIEVKPVGHKLNSGDLDQVTVYAMDHGTDWAILTNGEEWHIYKLVRKGKGGKINREKFFEVNLFDFDYKDSDLLEKVFSLTKEARRKSALDAHYNQNKAKNPFRLAALLTHQDTVKKIQSMANKIAEKDVKISAEEISDVLKQVINFTYLDPDEEKVKEAKKLVNRKVSASKRVRTKKADVVEKVEIDPNAPVAPPVQAVETATPMQSPQGTGV